MHRDQVLIRLVLLGITLTLFTGTPVRGADLEKVRNLSVEPEWPSKAQTDWLIDDSPFKAGVYRDPESREVVLANGLLRRAIRVSPNGATVSLRNLMTDEEMLRSVRPEARLTIGGKQCIIGGLVGHKNHAFLRPSDLKTMKARPDDWKLADLHIGPTVAPFKWKPRTEWLPVEPGAWPAPGVRLTMTYSASGKGSSDKPAPRKILLAQKFSGFGAMPKGWKLHESSADPRCSFQNEGKPIPCGRSLKETRSIFWLRLMSRAGRNSPRSILQTWDVRRQCASARPTLKAAASMVKVTASGAYKCNPPPSTGHRRQRKTSTHRDSLSMFITNSTMAFR
jgi:hypothetical protein